jgi:tRNA threonylcarbamoyladenosine biosynthesis protein TsaB
LYAAKLRSPKNPKKHGPFMTGLRILALESSSRCATVALLQSAIGDADTAAEFGSPNRQLRASRQGLQLLHVASDDSGKSSSATLVTSIQAAMKSAGWRFPDLGLIAITTGPGSFTGLRIGVVTAKTLSFATGIPVVGVNTLEAIAASFFSETAPDSTTRTGLQDVHAIIDAGRGELFAGHFRRSDAIRPAAIVECQLVTTSDWLKSLRPPVIIAGPGQRLFRGSLAMREEFVLFPENHPALLVESVGRIGAAKFAESGADDHLTLQPNYVRPSAAEETWSQTPGDH